MLTETPWSMSELKVAIKRAKDKRTGDALGLVAELLKHAPEACLENLLEVFRDGEILATWKATIFKMFPKSAFAKFASDSRPIAILPLLFKIFANLIYVGSDGRYVGRHTTRRATRFSKTANLCLQKTLAANIPLWIMSLDLSKAFNVDWDALWLALMQHGVSQRFDVDLPKAISTTFRGPRFHLCELQSGPTSSLLATFFHECMLQCDYENGTADELCSAMEEEEEEARRRRRRRRRKK